jgi:hypothetical protein
VDRPLRDVRGGGDDGRTTRGVPGLANRDRRTAADKEVTAADEKVDRAADTLQSLADSAAAGDGIKHKLAEPLADDANFVRKLKPSLMRARAKGELPTDEQPGQGRVAPAGPQLGKRPKPPKSSGGPSPFAVLGGALATGIAIAKWIDWRGHAHPKR